MKRLVVLLLLCAPPAFAQYLTPASGVQLRLEAQFTGSCSTTNPPVGIARDSGKQFCCLGGAWAQCDVATGTAPYLGSNFVVYNDGGTYKARSGATGSIAYSGTDIGAVLQSCVTSLGAGGGIITILGGTYNQSTAVSIPRNPTGWLRILGSGRPTLKLTAAGIPAFTVTRVGDYDLFGSFHLEGIEVDANSQTSGGSPMLATIFGAWNCIRCDFDGFIFRDIKTKNVVTDTTLVNNRGGIIISTVNSSGDQSTPSYVKNVVIDQVNMVGGNLGINLSAYQQYNPSYLYNAYGENLVVRNSSHTTGIVPTSFFGVTNLHFAGSGNFKNIQVDGFSGTGSGDDCIEINTAQSASVKRWRCTDTYNVAVTLANFGKLQNPDAQQIVFEDGVIETTSTFIGGNKGFTMFASDLDGTGAADTVSGKGLGDITIRNTVVDIRGVRTDACPAAIFDEYTSLYQPPRTLTVDGLSYSVDHSYAGTTNPTWCHLIGYYGHGADRDTAGAYSSPAWLNLRNVNLKIKTRNSSTGKTAWKALMIGLQDSAPTFLNIDGLTVDYDYDDSAAEVRGIDIYGASSVVHGRVKRYMFREAGGTTRTTNTFAVRLNSGMAAANTFTLEDSDLRSASLLNSGLNGTGDIVADTAWQGYVRTKNVLWRNAPSNLVAPSNGIIGVKSFFSASPIVWQNTFWTNERVCLASGVTTDVEISDDGVTYATIVPGLSGGITTTNWRGCVTLLPTQYIRITHGGSPSVSVWVER